MREECWAPAWNFEIAHWHGRGRGHGDRQCLESPKLQGLTVTVLSCIPWPACVDCVGFESDHTGLCFAVRVSLGELEELETSRKFKLPVNLNRLTEPPGPWGLVSGVVAAARALCCHWAWGGPTVTHDMITVIRYAIQNPFHALAVEEGHRNRYPGGQLCDSKTI